MMNYLSFIINFFILYLFITLSKSFQSFLICAFAQSSLDLIHCLKQLFGQLMAAV